MASSDNFGSSDEEDEDEGWLTQSTFNVNPIPPRPLTERRPLGSSVFEVSSQAPRLVSYQSTHRVHT